MAGKNVSMLTDNICHEVPFEWEIKNALEISNKIHGEIFALNPKCKTKFKSALKVVKSGNSVKLSVGFQRADRCNKTLTVITKLKFSDSDSHVYTSREARFVSIKSCMVHWCISGMFASIAHKLNSNKVTDYSDSDLHSSSTKGLTSESETEYEHKYLKGGLLIVKGALKVYGCCIDSNIKFRPSFLDESTAEDTVKEVVADFQLAYESNLYTDVCLKVSDFYIRAHKFVLSARCPYFNRLLLENKIDVIEVNDMDKNVLESFLRFLYTGIVGEVRRKTLQELYSIANKYEVTSLMKHCSYKMKTNLKYSNACEVLQLADKYNDEDLKIHAIGYITEHFENDRVANNLAEILKNNPELAANVFKIKSLKNISAFYA